MKNKLILKEADISKILKKEYKKFLPIISDKFGIVNAILERYELSEYGLYMYQSLTANVKDLFDLTREVSSGGLGVDESINKAFISCIAEAIERYCMSFIPKNELIFKKKSELQRSKIFRYLGLYSQPQYKKNKNFLNPYKDKIHWTKITSINNKKIWKYWPASLVYLPFEISKTVAENTSTGTAAGQSINDCILNGLLELIERDALMINFLQKLNPPEIDINSISGENKDFILKLKKKFNIKIYKLYSNIDVPIYCSYIWNGFNKKTHFGIGASANLVSDIAIKKSLEECLFTFFYSKNILDLKQDNPKKIKTLYEHFLYYQGENFKKLLFKNKMIKYEKETTTFKKLLKCLSLKKLDIFYKELTTEDVRDINIKVVKVIIPQLIDLNKDQSLQRLAARRFWNVPKNLGLSCKKTLSKNPHPFP